ncbi:hypothetical protein MED297_02662 [Reinekea sp. MED297]|uniref:Alpha/beta hydrolase fold-5 domain-containing protein n=1 Tax=Reinekea blandensis MED297 TaxID=314283 RepID=A4BEQ9_9GAMM|nr:hypothetical protein MED297_02662 [Reinekea sp. MED297] [Reinekea blandensis MED297]
MLAPSYPAASAITEQPSYQTSLSETTGWLVFSPTTPVSTGVVFYPGGKVQPEAYAPLAETISQTLNATVIIVPMPLNLAVLGASRGEEVPDAFPSIQHWFIGGHSLGGTMAASRVYKHPERWDGLVLLASYPQDSHDLSQLDLPVISIIGDRDGLINQDTWRASLQRLPATAQRGVIPGGNHAGFADYGPQEQDNFAGISPEQQRAMTAEFLADWLSEESHSSP